MSIERLDGTAPKGATVSARRFGVILHDLGMDPASFLFAPAGTVDSVDLAFMLQHTCGLLAVTITDERAGALDIPRLPRQSGRPEWCLTVDAREDISTGVSASDRATTAGLLARSDTVATQLVRPGHMLVALQRPLDIQSWIGPAAALAYADPCSGGTPAIFGQLLTNSNGPMSPADAEKFAADHGCEFTRASDLLVEAVMNDAVIDDRGNVLMVTGKVLTVQLGFDASEHHLVLPAFGEPVDDRDAWLNEASEAVICAHWARACTDCRYQVLDLQRRHARPTIAMVDRFKHEHGARPESLQGAELDLSSAYRRAVVHTVKQLARRVPAHVLA